MRILLYLLAALILLLIFDYRLSVRGYTVYAERLTKPMRIALVTDHHSSPYGQEQEKLVKAIHARCPDLILMAGDLVDDKRKTRQTEFLFRELSGYPIYYTIGNHECRRKDVQQVKEMARRYGITVVEDELVQAQVDGQSLIIGGIEDTEKRKHQDPAFDHSAVMKEAFGGVPQMEGYRILIAHRPELIERYCRYGFDLVVSGHAHGGQVRIPGLLNGLFAPGQGLFPKWAGGVYLHGGTAHVVSRGLSKTVFPPRVFNRPEVVMIDLVPEKGAGTRF